MKEEDLALARAMVAVSENAALHIQPNTLPIRPAAPSMQGKPKTFR